jgi:hypothetical protein
MDQQRQSPPTRGRASGPVVVVLQGLNLAGVLRAVAGPTLLLEHGEGSQIRRYARWMRFVLAFVLIATAALAVAAVSAAHRPGTDGGPAERGRAPIFGGATYVGVTNVSCRVARKVARGVINGRAFSRWSCAQPSGSFGHCHGRGLRRGAMVND